jgi:hypothetical protein
LLRKPLLSQRAEDSSGWRLTEQIWDQLSGAVGPDAGFRGEPVVVAAHCVAVVVVAASLAGVVALAVVVVARAASLAWAAEPAVTVGVAGASRVSAAERDATVVAQAASLAGVAARDGMAAEQGGFRAGPAEYGLAAAVPADGSRADHLRVDQGLAGPAHLDEKEPVVYGWAGRGWAARLG